MSETIRLDLIPYHPMQIDLERLGSLCRLLQACGKYDIKIKNVFFYKNGFQVLFEDMPGDAILHDGSYGRLSNDWETIGMPWDGIDVSVHDPDTLALLIYAALSGKDWTQYEGD